MFLYSIIAVELGWYCRRRNVRLVRLHTLDCPRICPSDEFYPRTRIRQILTHTHTSRTEFSVENHIIDWNELKNVKCSMKITKKCITVRLNKINVNKNMITFAIVFFPSISL